MKYVDGFLCAVPTANKDAYRTLAERASELFKSHGALAVVECWGDQIPEGKINSMHTAVLRKPDETVVFSWIVWPSRAVRDAAMPRIMTDPLCDPTVNPLPFDGTRLILGGFEVILDA